MTSLNYGYAYAYDSIGNRMSVTGDGVSSTYVANNLNQYTAVNRTIDQLVLRSLSEGGSEQSNNFTYDADGNMTQDDRFTYAYDCENRLVSVTPLNPQYGSRSIENVYDHRSRRIKKNVKSFDGMFWNISETHVFVWDGWNIVFEQIDYPSAPSRHVEYFWGNDVSETEEGAGGVGGLLATRIDGVFYIPVYGGNGNIMMYVSESGSIAAQYDYDPYGNILQSSGPLATQLAFGFSTKYHDREVGLVAYQLRTYNPAHGRWLNRDPVEEEGGENLYTFCLNSTCSYCDLLGLHNAPWNSFFKEQQAEIPILSKVEVTIRQVGSHYRGHDFIVVSFVPRFTPPSQIKVIRGNGGTGVNALGGSENIFVPRIDNNGKEFFFEN